MSRMRLLSAVILVAGCILTGCGTYVPEGATVVSVKNSKREFDRADLRPPANELRHSEIIPMKWYDTNTFLTTAPLSPGTYSFRARNFDGGGISRDIVVEADKGLYEIDVNVERGNNGQETPKVAGPKVQGRVVAGRGTARDVTVLFIGNEVVMRTVPLSRDGAFSVDAPGTGRWKIEVHQLGVSPVSYVHPSMELKNAVDLGGISLK